jgi:hypothetical protein
MSKSRALGLLIGLLTPFLVIASEGDIDPAFQSCVKDCIPKQITLFWSSREECYYDCMHQMTLMKIQKNEKIVQYFGKWPFYRLWMIQEPASVLFSFIHLIVHWRHWAKIRLLPFHSPMSFLCKSINVLSINLWVWSSVFHSRDWPWTEKLDYFSAMSVILWGLIIAISRVFGIKRIMPLLVLSGVFFVGHVSYLSFWSFNYVYNMAACLVIATLTNLCWFIWIIKTWKRQGYYTKHMLKTLAIMYLAMSFEIFDFPPIQGILDAHALWHGISIFAIGPYYEFIVNDMMFLTQKTVKD